MNLSRKLLSIATFGIVPRTAVASAENTTFNPLAGIQQFPISSYSGNMTRIAPVLSISHGGGPMPVLGDPSHAEITKSLQTKVPEILKLGTPDAPKAIVLVTAHWSTNKVHISSGARHELLYDYYGFPDEAYKLKHNAPGSPEVAGEVHRVLKEAGIDSVQDSEREWDHGVFIPMMLIDPKATVPIVQVSVLASESPSQSFAIGRALSSLRAQNIAIIGSGFATFHNLRLMFSGASSKPDFKQANIEWSNAVSDAATTDDVKEREKKFDGWRNWPSSYTMHPRGGAEHFLPLIVCAGAGGEVKGKKYADDFRGIDMWSYYWDSDAQSEKL
ncbi:Extradiol ring-cleavage dioxygenase, class III enzyme, subunit B [Boeremia exigua]|uniref:Extradiol ring-cleavage dioxygenase, class III enzyme, subunit B n=1 Tax=Boeremia exigua TaxID=749465 RepID=UPI001E8CD9FF|nr:Extradiol ring-cleavage dioxygenase, class III enzyme, subunit B [Boeremia exigua]KAH6644673.1 Extradiol ring-cleavage dioxygenase, class III enzyme, subunit B [Boeremia exigua]